MHMVAARLGLRKAMVGTGWATPALIAWTGLENTTLTLQRASFWQEMRKAAWALSGCMHMATDSADITCSLMSGCGQSHETAY